MTDHNQSASFPGTVRRIVVIGNTGTGKTTLARALAVLLRAPHIELDALHWGPDWTPVPAARFRERVAQAVMGESWVADGNYSAVRDLLWPRADLLVWLDYSLATIFWRLTRRNIRRVATREPLWHGNRETFRTQFLSRDSLYLWAVRAQRRNRRRFLANLAQPAHAHLVVQRLRSPREANRWLASVRLAAQSGDNRH